MKSVILFFWAMVLLMVGGCTGITPIKSVPLPPVTTIEGKVTRLDENGFTLTDSSGSIFVKARLPDNKKLNFTLEEKLRVYGNLQGGQEKIFDGYVIKRTNGEQIMITNPTPHFGFIIQGSFY